MPMREAPAEPREASREVALAEREGTGRRGIWAYGHVGRTSLVLSSVPVPGRRKFLPVTAAVPASASRQERAPQTSSLYSGRHQSHILGVPSD